MMSYVYLISVVLLGTVIAFYVHKKKGKALRFLLTFSGAYLLSLGVFHLLPEMYEGHDHFIGLCIMGGFFLQLVLEFFSKGIEHGHGHMEHFKEGHIPLSVVLALYVHALLESLPIGAHTDPLSKQALLWGILIHKLPVSIIYVSMLFLLKTSRFKFILWIAAFALVAPVGVWIGESFPVIQKYHKEVTAVVFGIFLHISTTILFESSASHKFNFQKLIVTLLGVTLAWFTLSHH